MSDFPNTQLTEEQGNEMLATGRRHDAEALARSEVAESAPVREAQEICSTCGEVWIDGTPCNHNGDCKVVMRASLPGPGNSGAIIERCAKIAEPWAGFWLDENSTDADRAVVAVRTEIAAKIRAIRAPTGPNSGGTVTDAIVLRLIDAAQTAQNDDLSKPQSEKRERHIIRVEAMLDAAEYLEELEVAALPLPPSAAVAGEPVAWRVVRATKMYNGMISADPKVRDVWTENGFEVETLYAAPMLDREAGWQPIETAPVVGDITERDPEIVMLWVSDGGHRGGGTVAFGRCYRSHDGSIKANATGFYGNWLVTHWMPLPEAPSVSRSQRSTPHTQEK